VTFGRADAVAGIRLPGGLMRFGCPQPNGFTAGWLPPCGASRRFRLPRRGYAGEVSGGLDGLRRLAPDRRVPAGMPVSLRQEPVAAGGWHSPSEADVFGPPDLVDETLHGLRSGTRRTGGWVNPMTIEFGYSRADLPTLVAEASQYASGFAGRHRAARNRLAEAGSCGPTKP